MRSSRLPTRQALRRAPSLAHTARLRGCGHRPKRRHFALSLGHGPHGPYQHPTVMVRLSSRHNEEDAEEDSCIPRSPAPRSRELPHPRLPYMYCPYLYVRRHILYM
jgi:hypothetical protein